MTSNSNHNKRKNDKNNSPNQHTLQAYITPEHDCPYLPNMQAKTVFLSPEIQPNPTIYSLLIDQGFRRSGDHIYRPNCDDCQACIPVRVSCNSFTPSKQQKRCFKKGQRFSCSSQPAKFSQQHYQLFERYISERHHDGDMYPTSEKQFKEFVLCDWLNTQFLNFYEPTTGQLIACCVYDQLATGLSAIYTFFDPDFSKFSPGRLAVLTLIERCKSKKLSYVYLGFWIKDCQKMSYKGEYRPIECFNNDRWVILS